jgi:dipeptidyl aminopeptidase/acylaminoacyl peptidase
MKTSLTIIAFLLPLVAFTQEEQRLSAELLWQLDRVDRAIVSPDGTQVVAQVTNYDAETGDASTRLWLLSASDTAMQRPLTADGLKSSSAAFSPDGSRLAFVSKRDDDEAGQIYVLPMRGPGEAVRLTNIPTGADALKWIGNHVYFISSVYPDKKFEEMAEIIKAQSESKMSAKSWNHLPYAYFDHFLDEARQNHVYRIPGDGGDVEALTLPTGLQLSRADAGSGDYDVAPDGSRLAFVAASSLEVVYPNLDVFLLTIGETDATNLTPDNPASDGQPQFAPNGRQLAYSQQRIAGFYGDQSKLMIHDLATGISRMVQGDWDRSAEGLVWSPDSRGMFGAIDDRATRRVYYIPLNSDDPVALTTATDYDQLSIAINGTLVARNQSSIYPPRVVLVDRKKKSTRRLDTFNDKVLANVTMDTYESVIYTGADGADIQMWVHYPPGFDKSKKYPLFLLIHGGPHGAMTDGFHFRWNAQTFSSWGYVTAWPNFHGSSGFGQEFTDSINPDWLTKPYADVIAAAEWLQQQPWIDSERMVAGGGSYGGYLSTVLLGKEHPFNALVIHAAVYDLYAQSSADFAVHDERFGPYWEKPDMYQSISPHYFASEFETPSLIIHGQLDLRVPVGQAFELFRTLQTRGVESRLVYYPDENHWVLKRDNSINWYGEVKSWVEKYAAPGPLD